LMSACDERLSAFVSFLLKKETSSFLSLRTDSLQYQEAKTREKPDTTRYLTKRAGRVTIGIEP
jgi:hypothetical protein